MNKRHHSLQWMTIRKSSIPSMVVLLSIGMFLTLVFLKVPLGEPRLRVEFYPAPPWQVSPGALEVSIGVANVAWLLAWAKDVRATVFAPEGFTITQTGTDRCELYFFTLYGGDGLGNGFTIRASNNISPGNYSIKIKVSGENVQEGIFTPKITVNA